MPSDSGLCGEAGTGAPPDVVVEKSTSGESGPPAKLLGSI